MTGSVARVLRLLGATLLLAAGAVHIVLVFDGYGTTTLEDLFALNGVATALAAAAVVLTRGPFAALAGIGVVSGSLLALALSRVGDGVIGFRGTGFDPAPEVPLTIVVEVAAVVVLATLAWRERQPLVDLVASSRAGATS